MEHQKTSNLRMEELARTYAAMGPIEQPSDTEMEEEEESGEDETVIEGLRFDLEMIRKGLRREREAKSGSHKSWRQSRKLLK